MIAFQSLVWPTVFAAASVAILAALHLLRVQPPRQRVATTLFWQQLVQQQRRRVLWERFQHWKTFLFLSLIALLLAIGLAGVKWGERDADPPVIVVIDAGARMNARAPGTDSRLQLALQQARTDLAALGATRVAILRAGTSPRVLLNVNEPAVLASRVLESIAADEQPATSDAALQLAASLVPIGRVLWYTDSDTLPPSLPQPIRERIEKRQVGSSLDNVALLSATFEPTTAVTGRLRVRIARFTAASQPIAVSLVFGAQQRRETVDIAADASDVVFDNLREDGSTCWVALAAPDALPADDRIELRLPQRPAFVFDYQGDVPNALRLALDALASNAPGIATRIMVSKGNVAGPAVVIDSSGPAVSSIAHLVFADGTLSPEGGVIGAGHGVGVNDPAATTLLSADGVPLASLSRDRLRLSDTLFSASSTLPQRPAFFEMLARAARHIAGWRDAPIALPAARMNTDITYSDHRDVVSINGDRASSDLRIAATPIGPLTDPSASRSRIELWQWVLASVGALFLIDTWLHLRGRTV